MSHYSTICKVLVFWCVLGSATVAFGAAPDHPPARIAAHPIHSAQALPAALRPAFYRALAKDTGSAYVIHKDGCATLVKQKLTACFNDRGARFTGSGSPLALHLTAYGRGSAGDTGGGELTAVVPVKPLICGNEARYRRANLTEWWRVLPLGFEQGFTIAKRPAGNGRLILRLVTNRQDAVVPSIRHSRDSGNPVENTVAWGKLRYGQLIVTDANGNVVLATLKSKGDRILIAVDDAHAVYPLTIDPLVWLEQKVTESDGSADDWFGTSDAIEGTTALVGAPDAYRNGHTTQGVVYVFTESNGHWSKTQELTASDGTSSYNFGWSVALDDTTAVIGARGATVNGNRDQGAAYVFTKSDGTWTQTQKLTASDGAAYDEFGNSVSLSGSVAVVGSYLATVDGNLWQGAAYVFTKSGDNWAQTQKFIASDGAADDRFGDSVAIDGATAFIGAPDATIDDHQQQGAVYVFTGSGGTWAQSQKLTISDDRFLGSAIALADSTALIAGDGVYVFDESNNTWTQTQKLTSSGFSVALDGAIALVGAPTATVNGRPAQGAVYAFEKTGGMWAQIYEFTASDGKRGDQFGHQVAVDGITPLVGAPYATVNGNSEEGKAYFYGGSDFDVVLNAPDAVTQGQQYLSQTIATNNSSVASPAVTLTVAIPAAASLIAAGASQGSCDVGQTAVSCNLGQIDGNAGAATVNVTLKAIGTPGVTISNTVTMAKVVPPLTASAPTTIVGGCPAGYDEYDGDLTAHHVTQIVSYQAAAGKESAILSAPAGFQLYVRLVTGGKQKLFRIPGNEIHRQAPAGTYTWGAKAGNTGGAYMLCIKHP